MQISHNKIEYCLDNISNCRAYYMGGSLCIDMMPYHPNVVLNTSGRGFAYGHQDKDQGFVMSPSVHNKVMKLYGEKVAKRRQGNS